MRGWLAGTKGTGRGREEVKWKELTSNKDYQGFDAGEGKAKTSALERLVHQQRGWQI